MEVQLFKQRTFISGFSHELCPRSFVELQAQIFSWCELSSHHWLNGVLTADLWPREHRVLPDLTGEW